MIFLTILIINLLYFHYITTFPITDDDDENLTPDLSYLGDSVFRKPSEETGNKVANWTNDSNNNNNNVNPEELGEYAEGDIIFPKKSERNGIIAKTFRWINGTIPYEISGYFDYESLNSITRAMEIYHKYTCIKFRKRTNSDNDYLSITNSNTGCWSSVGRVGGRQELNLQNPGCTTKVGTSIHELMHAAGFLHEQNRSERDNYVKIIWENIRKGHQTNFNKAKENETFGFGVKYDFKSVMHYSSKAFSANGKSTIVPKDSSNEEKMGQREGFSRGDLIKLNKMYNCSELTEQVTGPIIIPPPNKENSNSLNNIAQGIINWIFH